MSINLDNYEEYFAAYVDKELSEQAQSELFDFLKKHPELQQEFDEFQMTVFHPDEHIAFPNMSALFKSTISDQSHKDELLVAYLDDELEEAEKQKMMNAIAKDPEMARQFEAIKNAKLMPDLSIVFPDKSSLYRTEKKKKIIYLNVWKYAAAAVLTGFMIWTFYPSDVKVVGKNNSEIVSAIKNPIQNKTSSSPEEIQSQPTKTQQPSNQTAITVSNQSVVHNKMEISEVKQSPEKEIVKNTANEKLIPTPIAPQTNFEIITAESRKPVESLNKDEGTSKLFIAASNEPSVKDLNQTLEPIYSKNEITDKVKESSEFYIMNTPSNEISRTKVGGFFKKVKRIIQRTNPLSQLFSNDDDGELHQKMQSHD